ncbi:MAG TPA: GH32 C-terminal domain-containing protein, partial [Roseiflexaceae bacterium]|nr:GH32 C-terminal domain-containing protein [Roseiflexaceae bacterium]
MTPKTAVNDGDSLYAPQSMRDERGRRLMWGCLWEGRSEAAQLSAGWAGVISLPRVLSPLPDGTLGFAPVTELEALRDRHSSWGALHIPPSSVYPLGGVQSDAFEMIVEFAPGDAAVCGVEVRRSAPSAERTCIVYDRERGRLEIDRSQSSASADDEHDLRGGRLALGDGEPLKLDIFVDRSVVEVFANG